MIGTNLRIGSYVRPFKKGPSVFYMVCTDIPPHPFFFAVVHAFVFVSFIESFIGGKFIRFRGGKPPSAVFPLF